MSSLEDAEKAYELAMKHSASGNMEGALKWARKAVSIDSNLSRAKVLVTSLERGHMPGFSEASTSASTSGMNGHAAANGSADGMRKRGAAAAASSAGASMNGEKKGEFSSSTAPKREYTKEQARVVAQVNKAGREQDYYAVLFLKKEDSPDENAIKKGYRKLALQLHPDKNGAPGADEAFKIVSKAFTILSDGDKKAIYDRYGGDPDSRGGGGSSGGSWQFSNFARAGNPGFRGYGPGMGGAEIDPQDLFNMFFGGGMGNGFGGGGTTFTFGGPAGFRTTQFGGGPTMRRPRAGGARNNEQENTSVILQLLPIIILGLFSLLSYAPTLFGTSDPSFTWKPQGAYRQPRVTTTYNVKYHVNPNEWNNHPFVAQANASPSDDKATSKLRGFEKRVETSYKNAMYNECDRQRQYQERRIQATWGTLGFGAKPEMEKKIRSEVYESCERLRDFGINYGPLV